MIYQKEIKLPQFKRGFHLIDKYILNELKNLPKNGLLNIFIKHSSAAISINENADPSVRVDFENIYNKLVPENESYYTHTFEGDDDMPAHVKTTLTGNSLTIPVTDGTLNLGLWQGIYLCEFRNTGGNRNIVLTVYS